MSSLATYGVLFADHPANYKYAFLESKRSTAQLISYQLILSSAILLVVLFVIIPVLLTVANLLFGYSLGVYILQSPRFRVKLRRELKQHRKELVVTENSLIYLFFSRVGFKYLVQYRDKGSTKLPTPHPFSSLLLQSSFNPFGKIYSWVKTNFVRIFLLFFIGLCSRFLINKFLGVDVFTEFMHFFSIIYYLNYSGIVV